MYKKMSLQEYCKISFTVVGKHKAEIVSFHIWENIEMVQIPQISFAD